MRLTILTTLAAVFITSASAACTPGELFCGIGQMLFLCSPDGQRSRMVDQCSGGCIIREDGIAGCVI
ncbi:hypothetical protein BJY04DRAFT_183707 [Aspergillus karnatakaensis]|uniref:uncharacterized protein n=1 Tax=Aspergillus karnatakaensis TaxID=1810916 RepID=UPI003CCCA14F